MEIRGNFFSQNIWVRYKQLLDVTDNSAMALFKLAMVKIKTKNRDGLNKDEKWYCTFHIQFLSPVSQSSNKMCTGLKEWSVINRRISAA